MGRLFRIRVRLLGIALLVLFWAPPNHVEAGTLSVQATPPTMAPRELRWQRGPEALPPGAQMTFLKGDPEVEGPFTVRLFFPAGYLLPPHRYTGVDEVTVMEGSIHLTGGDWLNEYLPEGSFFLVDSDEDYVVWTVEDTVLQFQGEGPWEFTYLSPADDPRLGPPATQ